MTEATTLASRQQTSSFVVSLTTMVGLTTATVVLKTKATAVEGVEGVLHTTAIGKVLVAVVMLVVKMIVTCGRRFQMATCWRSAESALLHAPLRCVRSLGRFGSWLWIRQVPIL
jgi:hypothetical protein